METSHHSKATEADDYDMALDRLVDTRGISYDDARRELGEPPYELYDGRQTPRGEHMGQTAAGLTVRRYENSADRAHRWATYIRVMLDQKRNEK
jgi:hypothetical protein